MDAISAGLAAPEETLRPFKSLFALLEDGGELVGISLLLGVVWYLRASS
jgi:hypothetical protein